MKLSKNMLRRMAGQGMTEYIIIVALIAIAAIGTFTYFGKTARNQVAGMAQQLAGQDATGQDAAEISAQDAADKANVDKGLATYDSDNPQ